MAAEVIGWWLGAVPGAAVVLRVWWQRRKLRQRLSALVSARSESADPACSSGQRFDLWQKRHCFARQVDSPAFAAAKRELCTSRPKVVRGMVGGGILAVAGGVLGSVVARAIA